MENILITLYEQGKLSEDEIKEFINWHSEIAYCVVCNKKLMHDDEAYDDEQGLGALCDGHSVWNEETSNYHAPSAKEIDEERDDLKAKLLDCDEMGDFEGADKLIKELQPINIFYNKKLKHEFKIKNRFIK